MDGIHTLFSDTPSHLLACYPSFSHLQCSLPLFFTLTAPKKYSRATSKGFEGHGPTVSSSFSNLPTGEGPSKVPT